MKIEGSEADEPASVTNAYDEQPAIAAERLPPAAEPLVRQKYEVRPTRTEQPFPLPGESQKILECCDNVQR